ncbi:MAG TPA: hypothetical protein VFG07_01755, partial [Thermoplasmata archaeon]|nr:hypothetical protein [Thermoplasmata archaeon]
MHRESARLAAYGTVLLLLATALVSVPSGASSNSGAPAPVHVSAVVHPPVHRHPASLRLAGHPSALQSSLFYTQEGATISQLNSSYSVAGVKSLSLQFTLVSSPYPVGYELNGLSDTGDWYQVVVSDNWPGCPSGYTEITEVWDNAQGSGPVNCGYSLTFSTGDTIVLGLNFTSGGNVCLDVHDVSSASSNIACQAQPDSGAKVFVPVQGIADSNGYFTGPMTEVVNETATSCPDYTRMPQLDYRGPSGTWVTQYTPWSDEFDAVSFTLCFSGGGTTQSLGRGDPTTYYVDTASGSGYGPRWGGGQNLSVLDSAFGWRYETDPVPIASATITADATTVRTGTTVHFTSSVSGGTSPYTAVWSLNGTFFSGTASDFNFTPLIDGSYTIGADGIDAKLNALAATPVVILASGPLSVQPIFPSPRSGGVDVGQTVTFSASVQGGIGPRSYVWSGLPAGCSTSNRSVLPCTTRGPGLFNVSVNVTDSNHTSVVSPVLSYRVMPTPAAVLGANLTELDVGESTLLTTAVSGGAGPFFYAWSGTPSGCPASAAGTLLCAPTAGGTFSVQVVVTDSNGALAVTQNLLLLVHTAPAVAVSASRTTAEVGQNLTLTAATSGGSGVFTFTWSAVPAGCVPGNSSRIACVLSAAGPVTVVVGIVDSLGGSALSTGVTVTVYPRLSVVLSVSPSSTASGGVVTFTAVVSGGVGSLHYVWAG